MGSRAQRALQSLISLRNAFGFKAVNSFNGKSMKEFDAEGASATRVPCACGAPSGAPGESWIIHQADMCWRPCRGECGGRISADGYCYQTHPLTGDRVVARQPVPETRECEGCGERKPLEEMSTGLLPGTGETFQCSECRGDNHG